MQEITLKNVKTKLGNYWILFTDQKNLNMETIFTNTENSKTNESSKFIYEFNSKLNLKNPNNKNIWLVNLSIYYTWRNIKSSCNTNIFQISVPTWNDELISLMDHILFQTLRITFNLSSIKHKTLDKNPPIQI